MPKYRHIHDQIEVEVTLSEVSDAPHTIKYKDLTIHITDQDLTKFYERVDPSEEEHTTDPIKDMIGMTLIAGFYNHYDGNIQLSFAKDMSARSGRILSFAAQMDVSPHGLHPSLYFNQYDSSHEYFNLKVAMEERRKRADELGLNFFDHRLDAENFTKNENGSDNKSDIPREESAACCSENSLGAAAVSLDEYDKAIVQRDWWRKKYNDMLDNELECTDEMHQVWIDVCKFLCDKEVKDKRSGQGLMRTLLLYAQQLQQLSECTDDSNLSVNQCPRRCTSPKSEIINIFTSGGTQYYVRCTGCDYEGPCSLSKQGAWNQWNELIGSLRCPRPRCTDPRPKIRIYSTSNGTRYYIRCSDCGQESTSSRSAKDAWDQWDKLIDLFLRCPHSGCTNPRPELVTYSTNCGPAFYVHCSGCTYVSESSRSISQNCAWKQWEKECNEATH